MKGPKPNEDGIIIHIVNDRFCDSCGEINGEKEFIDGMCDAHTHGMEEQGFAELQMVLFFSADYIMHVLNTVAKKVINGEVVEKNGAIVKGLFPDGAEVRLDRHFDKDGKEIYRVIIPDGKFHMPEDSDEYPYNMQGMSPYIKNLL